MHSHLNFYYLFFWEHQTTVMLASVPFLLITFCVYGAVRELRNLHGKCLMCYVFSLTILYLSIAIVQIWHSELLDFSVLCTAFGYSFLMSLLMCFFWLNAMCFDIWSTFRWVRLKKSQGMKTFKRIIRTRLNFFKFELQVFRPWIIYTENESN